MAAVTASQYHIEVDRWDVWNHLSFFNDEIRQPPIYVHHRPSHYPFKTTTFSSCMQKRSAEVAAEAAATVAAEAMAFHMIIMTIASSEGSFVHVHAPSHRVFDSCPLLISFHLIYVLLLRIRWVYLLLLFCLWCVESIQFGHFSFWPILMDRMLRMLKVPHNGIYFYIVFRF